MVPYAVVVPDADPRGAPARLGSGPGVAPGSVRASDGADREPFRPSRLGSGLGLGPAPGSAAGLGTGLGLGRGIPFSMR